MSKKYLGVSFITAALLPWLLFSNSLHDNVNKLLSQARLLFPANNVDSLIARAKSDLVDIKGGEFYFGKFDMLYGDQRYARPKSNEDLSPREVSINDFSIAKYQVTYADYAIYTEANDKESIENTDPEQKKPKDDRIPVLLTWQEAQDYCQWLGKLSGKKMDLSTEKQWEYAARSRGQFILYPTDTGIVEPGRNVPLEVDKVKLEYSVLFKERMPVGMFPPNPLGLYDLASNGMEWTRDIYEDPHSWANKSKRRDDRVARSYGMSSKGGAPTISRHHFDKDARNTARCVMEP